jgi:large subunit ribosomal protein L10
VKIGVVERRTVSTEEVTRLAELPPKDQLLAAIAGSLTAGVGGIAGALNSLIRDIAYMVEEVAKQGEQ